MNFKESIKKLQALPEEQKKKIMWAIVAVIAIIFFIFWFNSAKQSLQANKLKDAISALKPPSELNLEEKAREIEQAGKGLLEEIQKEQLNQQQ